ncbi:hypothetical protein [Nocardia sp. alder85J]|uniref:hypothetical protein n=1 Tax=Nocardia sp. alder85J TaxID=2862949 RepID=UPI001CD7E0C0|nr:hypothetical protein [Nocardia sp. alder85J]MCX4093041.1 hypothetical protein [Nocardia sp. alder85J]
MNIPAPSASGAGSPPAAGTPDLGFTLGVPTAAEVVEAVATRPVTDDRAQADNLARAIAGELGAGGPPGWRQVDAIFALTVSGGVSFVFYTDARDRVARFEPSPRIIELARAHREVSARAVAGPWWRMELRYTASGELDIDHDYGEEPFPENQLLAPSLYIEDLETFPRNRVPVWLGAYIGHGGRQHRPPARAAARARADRDAGIVAGHADTAIPPLSVMWARWAAIAAAFAAVESPLGPRILPSQGYFEGARHSGSTLYRLPGDRAVLSGGVWNAPVLDAVYNTGADMPDFYAGAPAWIADPVLNARASSGLLSFCYWWGGDGWYCARSPSIAQISEAVPGMWTAETTADVVRSVAGTHGTTESSSAAATFVLLVESGRVSVKAITDVFDVRTAGIDSAVYQLSLAGVAVE